MIYWSVVVMLLVGPNYFFFLEYQFQISLILHPLKTQSDYRIHGYKSVKKWWYVYRDRRYNYTLHCISECCLLIQIGWWNGYFFFYQFLGFFSGFPPLPGICLIITLHQVACSKIWKCYQLCVLLQNRICHFYPSPRRL